MKLLKSIPALPVYNMEAAVTFYEEKFNFTCRHKESKFSILSRDNLEVHLWSATDEGWKSRNEPIVSGAESFLAGTASCRIEVEGIDTLFEQYKKKGVLYNIDTVVEEKPWGTREFAALDLDGNLLMFYEKVEERL